MNLNRHFPGNHQFGANRRRTPLPMEGISLCDHHVAEIDADAKLHPVVFDKFRVADHKFFLDRDGATHRLDRTGELGNDTVAGAAEYTPIMGLDQLIDYTAIGFKSSEGCFLILAHEPGVPNHIGGQDKRQAYVERVP